MIPRTHGRGVVPGVDRREYPPDNPYLHLLDELEDDGTPDPRDVRLGLAIPPGWNPRRRRRSRPGETVADL